MIVSCPPVFCVNFYVLYDIYCIYLSISIKKNFKFIVSSAPNLCYIAFVL